MQNDTQNIVDRVKRMELIFDELSEAVRKDPVSVKNDNRLSKLLSIITEYYEGGQWQKDYEADERGEIPIDLKRGVLSEDGVYNLLCDIDNASPKGHKLIFNQNDIPKEQWRYGLRSSAAVGCGWIATYNALRIMGKYAKPEKLIRYYEHVFPGINGNFGTFIPSVVYFFRKNGFLAKVIVKRSLFDEAIKNNDVGILFFYWKKEFEFGAHFVAVYFKEGRFRGINTFKNSKSTDDYGESLDTFIKKQKYFLPVLIAIKKENTNEKR